MKIQPVLTVVVILFPGLTRLFFSHIPGSSRILMPNSPVISIRPSTLDFADVSSGTEHGHEKIFLSASIVLVLFCHSPKSLNMSQPSQTQPLLRFLKNPSYLHVILWPKSQRWITLVFTRVYRVQLSSGQVECLVPSEIRIAIKR